MAVGDEGMRVCKQDEGVMQVCEIIRHVTAALKIYVPLTQCGTRKMKKYRVCECGCFKLLLLYCIR